MKKIFLIPLILVFIALIIIFFPFKNKEKFQFVEVKKDNVYETISFTGEVKKAKEVFLSFQQTEKVKKIYVKVGDKVKNGDKLAELENSDLWTKLRGAEAGLDAAKASLEKLINGATKEDLQIYETKVEITETAKNNAQKNLEYSFKNSFFTIRNDILAVENVSNIVETFTKNYVSSYDDVGIKIRGNFDIIKGAEETIKSYFKKAETTNNEEDIYAALNKNIEQLGFIYKAVNEIRSFCDTSSYYEQNVSLADKSSLDTQKSQINTALNNTIIAKQNIDSLKSGFETATINLKLSQNDLEKLKTPAREEDIKSLKAQIETKNAEIELINLAIEKTFIRACFDGIIAQITLTENEFSGKEQGISLIPENNFELEGNVSEMDVGKLKTGDLAKTQIDAFNEEWFNGKVTEVELVPQKISGAVYYKAKITLEETDEKLKSGMTADVKVIIDERKNVLVLPSTAIGQKNGDKIARILQNNKVKEIKIKTGMVDLENDKIEIISGLNSGDKVINNYSKK